MNNSIQEAIDEVSKYHKATLERSHNEGQLVDNVCKALLDYSSTQNLPEVVEISKRTHAMTLALKIFGDTTIVAGNSRVINILHGSQRFSDYGTLFNIDRNETYMHAMSEAYANAFSGNSLWGNFSASGSSNRVSHNIIRESQKTFRTLMSLACEGWNSGNSLPNFLHTFISRGDYYGVGSGLPQHFLRLKPSLLKAIMVAMKRKLRKFDDSQIEAHEIFPLEVVVGTLLGEKAFGLPVALGHAAYSQNNGVTTFQLRLDYRDLIKLLSKDGKNISSKLCKSFCVQFTRTIKHVVSLGNTLLHGLSKQSPSNNHIVSDVDFSVFESLVSRLLTQNWFSEQSGLIEYSRADGYEGGEGTNFMFPDNYESLSLETRLALAWNYSLSYINGSCRKRSSRINRTVTNENKFTKLLKSIWSYEASLSEEDRKIYNYIGSSAYLSGLFTMLNSLTPETVRSLKSHLAVGSHPNNISRTTSYNCKSLYETIQDEEGNISPFLYCWHNGSIDRADYHFDIVANEFKEVIKEASLQGRSVGAMDILKDVLGEEVVDLMNRDLIPTTSMYCYGRVIDQERMDSLSEEAQYRRYYARSFSGHDFNVRNADLTLTDFNTRPANNSWGGNFFGTMANTMRDTGLIAGLCNWIAQFSYFYGWNPILNQEILDGSFSTGGN